MDEFTFSLDYPIKLNEFEYREITLKRPKLGHFKQCQHLTGFEETIKMISLVSGVPPLAVEQMDMIDVRKASDFFAELMTKPE